ncbi:MAG: hypothetical protein GXO27_05285 [Chlorobi bacterium]|nr:hypothetical protein [Chlorobiota bacterium]
MKISRHIGWWVAGLILAAGGCVRHSEGNAPADTPRSSPVGTLSPADQSADAVFMFGRGKDIYVNWTVTDEHDKKNNRLMFARFDTEKSVFDSIREVPPARGLQMHPESMAKVAAGRGDTLWAVYRKKLPGDRSRFGGHMFYAVSSDGGRMWGPEIKLVEDSASTSQSFYDVALLPDGRMGLTWLDSRCERRGKSLRFAVTEKGGRFGPDRTVARSTCECCRTDIYADSAGVIHIAYRNLIEPDEPGFDGQGDVEIRDMYYLYSTDTGRTFTEPVPISRDYWHVYGCPHTGPSLARTGDSLGAVWFTAARNMPGIFFTTGKDGRFAPRRLLAPEGRHPQMVALGGKFYAVYEEYYEQDGKGYYRIVLEEIEPGGVRRRFEVSPPLTRNDHAVLAPAGKGRLLVAWINRDTRRPKVMYRLEALPLPAERELPLPAGALLWEPGRSPQ